jgi:hypothetical protein
VCSATATEEEGSNPRGRDTKDYPPFAADCVANSVVHKCLASAAGTIEEKELAAVCLDRRYNPVMCMPLLKVELGRVFFS